MTTLRISNTKRLNGILDIPGDKSISHRALMLGALADGTCEIRNFLTGGDCLATKGCMRSLGIAILGESPTTLRVHGKGLHGLKGCNDALDCVRSGTTMRLLAGLLAGQEFDSILGGDEQLLRRPMNRVAQPLKEMGAKITTTDGHGPLTINGAQLRGQQHTLAIASAQVKSALLLAGLYAQGQTRVVSPGPSRDHTERMLNAMGVNLETDKLSVSIKPASRLTPFSIKIPGDFSSAAFIMAAGLLVNDSEVLIRDVGINATRTGLLDVLKEMGASITLENERLEGNEPVADLLVKSSSLKGVRVAGDTVVRMIDEFPLLAVLASQAEGITTVSDASELRVKETDRILTITTELKKMGARIESLPDGFTIEGPIRLHGAILDSHGDHRLAMSLAVAGLVSDGEVQIQTAECISDSFPGFIERMQSLGANYA